MNEQTTKMRSTTRSEALASRANRLIPGGVNSPVRAYGAVGGTPRFLVSGRGALVADADGNEYVDLVAAWGPALLGHAHPAVIEAVQRAAADGLGFGASVPGEAELVEAVIERLPLIERMRLVSTGTEATMTAIRLARGATGRPLLIKFAGHYHGHSDGLLAAAGSGLATFAMPGSAGVTEETAAQTLVLPYNDFAALEAAFEAHGDRIAAVIAEAAACNMGVIPPAPGFTRHMIEVAHRHGALVILDEVLTGFRAGPSGFWALEAAEMPAGVAPDLLTFGKVIGGGLPLAGLGGRADLMNLLAPLGPVYQAGTLSGNPLAVAAGLATLQHADAEAYDSLSRASLAIERGVSAALTAAGVAHCVQRAGTLFSVFFGEFAEPPREYAQVRQATSKHRAFFHSMLDQGVNLPPSAFEAWFVTAAHDDAAIGRVLDALPAAARAAAVAN